MVVKRTIIDNNEGKYIILKILFIVILLGILTSILTYLYFNQDNFLLISQYEFILLYLFFIFPVIYTNFNLIGYVLYFYLLTYVIIISFTNLFIFVLTIK
jgi:hypothetical protein